MKSTANLLRILLVISRSDEKYCTASKEISLFRFFTYLQFCLELKNFDTEFTMYMVNCLSGDLLHFAFSDLLKRFKRIPLCNVRSKHGSLPSLRGL